MRTSSAVMFVALALLLSGRTLQASQVPAHVYVALKALEGASPVVRNLLSTPETMQAYLAGTAGPDVANTACYVQLGLGLNQPGYESHKLKTGDITCNLFRLAKGDVQTAYCLGWLTHWELDLHVHPLVNKYGGVYHVDPTWHKHLEQVECEHVFQKVGKTAPDTYIPAAAACPTHLINAAFAATFPTGGRAASYKPSKAKPHGSDVEIDVPPYFEMQLPDGASNMEVVARSWVEMHNTNTYSGAWATVENKVATKGPPPTPDEYKVLMEPLKIDDVKIQHSQVFGQASRLRVEYTVNDARLIKPFCDAWDKVVTAAIPQVTALMNRWAADPAGFTLENADLDNGRAGYDENNPDQAWPGKPDIREMLVFVTLKDGNGKPLKAYSLARGQEWDPTGEWVPLAPLQGGILAPPGLISTHKVWKGTGGRGYFEILLDASEPNPVEIEIKAQLADKKDKKPYGVEHIWTQKKKPEMSILFLVDCSGSMDGAKLEAAKAAVRAAVQQTNDGKTEWGLMRFGGCSVRWVCKFVMDPAIIEKGIERLSAGGDTPLTYARGLAIAECVSKGHAPKGRVTILCDGQDNCTEHGSRAADEAEDTLRALLPPQNIDVPMGAPVIGPANP